MGSLPQITIVERDKCLVVTIHHKMLDAQIGTMLRDATLAAAKARQLPVVLDLSHVQYLPSIALGVLIALNKDLNQAGRVMVVAGMTEPVKRLLTTTGLDRLLTLADTVKMARVQATHASKVRRPDWDEIATRKLWVGRK